ncbi:hypothetical protein [Micromonospora sp. ATCC 39149]|uniref:hypothetical protein n=1 Tax=Micromonospora sp. (strain ATCC 39149 / NRRL 15099 / SCC 1413) TaxID=219305 RepID=UPI00056B7585|nr:hypothetical protein [Micromonospora sp. ATCC 39149]
MHLPAAMNGGPHQQTARHVYLGMAGPFIVDDPTRSRGILGDTICVDGAPTSEDRELMGQFVVVEPGQVARKTPPQSLRKRSS